MGSEIKEFQFYISTIITLWGPRPSGVIYIFQFYISTIITKNGNSDQTTELHISILHKYDYNELKAFIREQQLRFQFYISTIIT